jgi:hypothetical protein
MTAGMHYDDNFDAIWNEDLNPYPGNWVRLIFQASTGAKSIGHPR